MQPTMEAKPMIRAREPMTSEKLFELLDPDYQPSQRADVVDLAIECLAALCIRARDVQAKYSESRDRGLWIEAKRLERRLDEIADRILSTSRAIEERTFFVEAGDRNLDQAVAAILASERPPSPPRRAG